MSVLDQISANQMQLAVNALHSHHTLKSSQEAENELLPKKDEFVWLTVSVKKSPPKQRFKPVRIPITHPIIDPRTNSVCLLTKDPQREYKDLLETNNIKFVSRVIGLTKLKGKHAPYEARRQLLKEHGLFLADDRIIPLLPRLLGTKWFEAKKQPIPVSLTKKDLKSELEKAINSTYMNQNLGTFVAIKIGTTAQTPAQIQSNLRTALPSIAEHIYGGWENVQSLGLKTNSSVSLPIWSCGLGDGEGERWAGMTLEEGEEDDDEEGSEEDDEEEEEDDEEVKGTSKVNAKKRSLDEDDEDDSEEEVKPKKKKAKEIVAPPAPVPAKSKKRKHEADGEAEAAVSVAKPKPTSKPPTKEAESALSASTIEKTFKKAKLASSDAAIPATTKSKPSANAEASTSAKKAKGAFSQALSPVVSTTREPKAAVKKNPKKKSAGVLVPSAVDELPAEEVGDMEISKKGKKKSRTDANVDSAKPSGVAPGVESESTIDVSVLSKKDKKQANKGAGDGPSKPSAVADPVVESNASTGEPTLSKKDKKKKKAGEAGKDGSSAPVVEPKPSTEEPVPSKKDKKKKKAGDVGGDGPSKSFSVATPTVESNSPVVAETPSKPPVTALAPSSVVKELEGLSKKERKKLKKQQQAEAPVSLVESESQGTKEKKKKEKASKIELESKSSLDNKQADSDLAADLAQSISEAYPSPAKTQKKDKLGTFDKKKEKVKSKLGKSVKDAILGKKVALS